MKAVILAGGKGTRLGKAAIDIPKPMVNVGSIPLLEHQINLLKKYGITDIILIIGHLSEKIEDHFDDGSRFGVNITFFKEKKPLGTTGGIKEIENRLTEDFLVLYGDVMVNMDLNRLVDFHKKNQSDCTLVLHPNDHPFDSDLVEISSENRIVQFHSKPHNDNLYYKNLVNAALYVMTPKVCNYIEKGKKADFGKDIFPGLYSKIKMFGYVTHEYLKDVGSPERLKEVIDDYNSGRIKECNIENKSKAVFLDRDGVINKEVHFLVRPEEFELLTNTGNAIKRINKAGYLAVVITNQSVIARNMCSLDDLAEIHKKMETLLGRERAKLDAIYFCPHHPDKGHAGERPEYKVDCDCRKPKAGMIKKAEKELNIELNGSFMVGDTERDIECGKKAGLITIGVKTGYGCKDIRIEPDFFCDSLAEAVDVVLKYDLKD